MKNSINSMILRRFEYIITFSAKISKKITANVFNCDFNIFIKIKKLFFKLSYNLE